MAGLSDNQGQMSRSPNTKMVWLECPTTKVKGRGYLTQKMVWLECRTTKVKGQGHTQPHFFLRFTKTQIFCFGEKRSREIGE